MKVRKNRTQRDRADRLPVAIYWYRGKQVNMGDEITPYLLAKILGIKPGDIRRLQKEPAKASGLVLVSVGSVLRLCHKNTLIWGSGLRNIDQPVAKALQFCAVRGPLTRRRLLELGYDCPEVYGDPAMLLPRYYSPDVSKRYRLGIIPHLVDYERLAQMYNQEKDTLVVDVRTADIEHIINQIRRCECTVSSSLHGIVLSVAYGVPTRWLKCSDKIMGDDTKFYDYFMSLDPTLEAVFSCKDVGLVTDDNDYEKYRPLRLNDAKIATADLMVATHTYESGLDLDKLIAAFPAAYFQCMKKSA